jgi:hypothetical protein
MLALTDQQLNIVQRAPRLLAPSARDTILRSIASRWSDTPHPSDGDAQAAVQFILSHRGVSANTHAFLCDSPRRTRHSRAVSVGSEGEEHEQIHRPC